MDNFLVINGYFHHPGFESQYKAIKDAFSKLGENLRIVTGDKALSELKAPGNGCPVLFFDKDICLGEMLELRGYRLINPIRTIEICDDKSRTYAALCGRVNMPETIPAPFTYSNIGYDNYDFVNAATEKLGFPLVIKRNKGSLGNEVRLAKNPDEAFKAVKEFESSGFLFQRYISESSGRDARLFVVGGKCVAAGMRTNKGDFRSNIGSGGSMTKFDPPKEYTEIAERAALLVKADFAGVDILLGKDGPLVLEINSNALFNALSKATGVDMAGILAGYYLDIKEKAV